MKASNKPGGHVKMKRVRKKRRNSPVFKLEIVAKIGRQINDRWPNLGRQLASLIRVSREKLDDIYSLAARVITEHKEAFEDRLAERKAGARAATRVTRQESAPGRPYRRGARGAEDGAVKTSGIAVSSKKPTRRNRVSEP